MPKTPESEAQRWARKAREYQEQLESSHVLLVTQECKLRRCMVVRWHAVSGEGRRPLEEREEVVQRLTVRPMLRNLQKNGVRIVKLVRVWAVVELNPFSTTDHEIAIWEHIEMAKAHRDGRNFHYAKWLMTKDMDKINNELTGGMRR